MMIFDSHVHVTPNGEWFGTGHDASLARAKREMDEAGVQRAALIPVPGRNNRDFIINAAASEPDRFFAGFLIERLDDFELEEMSGLLASGDVSFVKVHPRMTGILPMDDGLTPFLSCIQKQGAAVVFCTYMRGPRLPMNALTPLVFDDLARRHPELRIVLAHAGAYRPLDALAVAQSHKNVYMDISHVLSYFDKSSVISDLTFIMDKLDCKLLFGSDFPEVGIGDYLQRARKIADTLTDFDADLFFAGTANVLFRSWKY